MKTEKFSIMFAATDIDLSTEIFISKKEYQKQFSFLLRQVKEKLNNEIHVEYRSVTHDLEKHVVTQHFFLVGTAETILTARGAKPGYYFK